MALELVHSFDHFLAVFVFLPHQLEPFLSSKLSQSGGGGGAAPHTPHDSSHFFAFLAHCYFFTTFLHFFEPDLSRHSSSSGGGGGVGGDALQRQLLQSHSCASSRIAHVYSSSGKYSIHWSQVAPKQATGQPVHVHPPQSQ